MRTKIYFLLALLFLSVGAHSQSYRDANPRQGDLKGDDTSVRNEDKTRKGCCKIKYPSGGYDFFVASEDECRKNLYFDRFLGENNSLCFHWKE